MFSYVCLKIRIARCIGSDFNDFRYLPCIPVNVPHKSIGFLPVGPLIVKESVQTPAAVSTKSKLSKSNLNWHISESRNNERTDNIT